MARTVSRGRSQSSAGTGVRLSEIIVFALIAAAVVAGVRQYFFVYRRSPSYALGEFLSAVKAGSVSRQYALIDDDDKADFPSEREYDDKALWARGFTERIGSIALSPEQPNPQNPDIVAIPATLSIRKSGQKVYEASSDSYNDQYKMHRDKAGNWKVWLRKSTLNAFSKATPSPKADSVTNG